MEYQNALQKSITVKNLLSIRLDDNNILGLEQQGINMIANIVYYSENLGKFHPQSLGFLIGKIQNITGVKRDNGEPELCNFL